MTDSSSLKDVIARCHRELNQLFFAHQEAVLSGEFPRAIESLQQFARAHHLHKDFEDNHLLPRLIDLDDPGAWPPSLYSFEHNKIDDLLARLEENLVRLSARELTGSALRFEIIGLLDQEKSFKGLCEHHQEREEAGMLAMLDRQTDAAWRAEIIAPFIDEWLDLAATGSAGDQ